MSHEEAAVVLSTLLAGFHGETLDHDSSNFWYDELERLGDSPCANSVARGLVRNEDRFPSIAHFIECYRLERKRILDAGAVERGLPEPRNTKIPEWVHVWWWIRRFREPRDTRPLPQQVEVADPLRTMTTGQYDDLKGEWSLAGAPRINSEELARLLLGPTT